MIQESQTILELPTKTTVNSTDKIMIVANVAGSNTGNVALITVGNLFGNANIANVSVKTAVNVGNSSSNAVSNSSGFFKDGVPVIAVGQDDPANSNSWEGPEGVLFFSNTYGYISIANDVVRRFALEDF